MYRSHRRGLNNRAPSSVSCTCCTPASFPPQQRSSEPSTLSAPDWPCQPPQSARHGCQRSGSPAAGGQAVHTCLPGSKAQTHTGTHASGCRSTGSSAMPRWAAAKPDPPAVCPSSVDCSSQPGQAATGELSRGCHCTPRVSCRPAGPASCCSGVSQAICQPSSCRQSASSLAEAPHKY